MPQLILRLLEDYASDPMSEQSMLYKQDLLLALRPPENGWLLVKVLRHDDSDPIMVPERLVTKVRPGLYRAIRYICNIGDNVHFVEGELVEVKAVKTNRLVKKLILDSVEHWKVMKLDGSGRWMFVDPQGLEAVDIPDAFPNTKTPTSIPWTANIANSAASSPGHERLQLTWPYNEMPPPPYVQSTGGSADPQQKN